MRYRALFSLVLYALAFVLWPGLHQVLPSGPCTDCVGEVAAPRDAHRPAAHECCSCETALADAEVERASAEESAPSPTPEDEHDSHHCDQHCSACRIVHGTSLDVPMFCQVAIVALAVRRLPVRAADVAPSAELRPRPARGPPLLG